MEAFGLYLLKSSVWLSGFGLIYLIFLRNERFFLLNRVFLISGMMASALFPLINWNYTVLIPNVPSVVTNESHNQIISTVDPTFSAQQFLLLLYLLGGFYLLFRILNQTSRLWRVIKNSAVDSFNSIKLIRTNAYPVSFSFFSFVFINPLINDTETNEIVNHEQEHINQKHWIDLVLFESLLLVQWFNPMIWIYGRFIRQNHEYLADEKALLKSANPAIYRAALLNQMFGGPVISLAHSFNYSLNTKRFHMMKNTICSPFRKLKLLLVLPLVAIVFYAFATPEYVFAETLTTSLNMPDGTQTAIKQKENIEHKADGWIQPDWKWESDTVKKAGIKIRGEAKNPLYVVDGIIKKNQTMTDINPDNIESISVWKGEKAIEKYGEKAKDGAIEITLKQGNSSNIEFKAKDVTAFGYKIISDSNSVKTSSPHSYIKFNGNGVIQKEDNSDSVKYTIGALKIRGTGKTPLLVVNGVITENQNINSVSPDSIASITILKDNSAKIVYGEKAKDGVIMITTKKRMSEVDSHYSKYYVISDDMDSKNQKISIEDDSFKGQTGGLRPLIVKDGVIAEDQDIKEYGTKEAIDKITILKGKEATDKYGVMGKNGVIELTTKKKVE